MSTFSKKLKSLIFVFVISILISFMICAGCSFKDKIFFSLKSLFFETPNIGYYNYEKIGDKFVVADNEHFLYIKNINTFVKEVKIKLKKPLDKGVSLKLFVNDIDLDKSLLMYEYNVITEIGCSISPFR